MIGDCHQGCNCTNSEITCENLEVKIEPPKIKFQCYSLEDCNLDLKSWPEIVKSVNEDLNIFEELSIWHIDPSIQLNLSTNFLKTFPKLTTLDLYNVDTEVNLIPQNDQDWMPKLKTLKLKHVKSFNIESKIDTIENLFVKYCPISDITGIKLYNLPNLKRLQMVKNSLTELPNKGFEHNPNLKILDLHENNITVVHAESLQGLESLEYLDLQDNDHLADLPPGFFDYVPNLKSLNISETQLDLSSTAFTNGNFTNLENLTVEEINTEPEHLFNFIRRLTNLRFLNIRNNLLTQIRTNDIPSTIGQVLSINFYCS